MASIWFVIACAEDVSDKLFIIDCIVWFVDSQAQWLKSRNV